MPGIETGLDRRDAMPYPWQGRPADLPLDPTYALRADYLNANWRQIMEAIGVVLITGQMCTEGSATYGSSTTTYCRLTLPEGYCELNDWLHIGDGSRQWRVQMTVENEIEFSDSDLIDGTAGTANYNAIQDDLMMWTLAKAKLTKLVTKNEIVTGDFSDGLHGDDIPVSQGSSDSIKDQLDDIYVEHESDGTHSAGVIGNSELDKDDVLISQGFVNRVRNGAFNLNDTECADYWTDIGTPSTTPTDNGKSAYPHYDLQFTTNALGEGVYQNLLYGFEANVPIRMSFVAWGDSGGEEIKAQMYTGVETATSELEMTTDPTTYYLTLTPTDISTLVVRFISNTASTITWHIALVTVCLGDIHTKPERSSGDVLYDAVLTQQLYVNDLKASGADKQYGQWVLERGIKILRADAYANTAPDANVTLRITDDATNYDVTVNNGANTGNNTADQEYAAGTLKLKVLTNTASTGGACILTVQYRVL